MAEKCWATGVSLSSENVRLSAQGKCQWGELASRPLKPTKSGSLDLDVNGGEMLGHWGGVKLYHPVGKASENAWGEFELTGQHKCPRQWLRGMPCLRAGRQTAGGKVLILPILRQARLKVGRQRSPCYA